MQFVAHGQAHVDARFHAGFARWIGAGLLISGGTGIASAWFGAPFLTSTYDYPLWLLVGEVPLASAALFDLGVWFSVAGATLLALSSLARLSGHRVPR
jgi:multicomponent K+:H+ antiporter subunit A